MHALVEVHHLKGDAHTVLEGACNSKGLPGWKRQVMLDTKTNVTTRGGSYCVPATTIPIPQGCCRTKRQHTVSPHTQTQPLPRLQHACSSS
jgi:hypothetical protein